MLKVPWDRDFCVLSSTRKNYLADISTEIKKQQHAVRALSKGVGAHRKKNNIQRESRSRFGYLTSLNFITAVVIVCLGK
jgi:hypothetical protein